MNATDVRVRAIAKALARRLRPGGRRRTNARLRPDPAPPATPRITVCIPVYRSGPTLRETLASVQAQSYGGFKVEIAVEPTGPDAIDPEIRNTFARDPRFHFAANPEVLGWAGNVSSLLSRVDTELVAVLPHDDMWQPDYLDRLIRAIDQHPAASVAYADVRRFGFDDVPRSIQYDNIDIGTRLYSYYLQGAEAHSWRGVIRTRCLRRDTPFPQNPFIGFAVECEFVQHLLCQGEAVRVPKELYCKRAYPAGAQSVSRRWLHELSAAEQCDALRHHRAAMLGGIPALRDSIVDRGTVLLAAEIAMLHRALIFARINPPVARQLRADIPAIASRLPRIADTGTSAELGACLERVAASLPAT